MSVSSEIARLSTAKASLKAKMEAVGYTVDDVDKIDAMIEALDFSGGETPVTPVLTLINDNATERVTSTTGRYWVQTGSAYKVRLKKYTVTKGAKYKIKSTKTLSYATCWFGDEFPALETYVNYVGLPISKTEWIVEATGSCMMVSFTHTATIASSVMSVSIVSSEA